MLVRAEICKRGGRQCSGVIETLIYILNIAQAHNWLAHRFCDSQENGPVVVESHEQSHTV